jgi:hypothetical protein
MHTSFRDDKVALFFGYGSGNGRKELKETKMLVTLPEHILFPSSFIDLVPA